MFLAHLDMLSISVSRLCWIRSSCKYNNDVSTIYALCSDIRSVELVVFETLPLSHVGKGSPSLEQVTSSSRLLQIDEPLLRHHLGLGRRIGVRA